MRKIKITGLALVTLAAATGISAQASARDDHNHRHHPVCHWEHHHGHKTRVCH